MPKTLTAAQRSELAKATWNGRPQPDHRRHDKTITAAAEVVDELTHRKGEMTWTEFFCDRFGIPLPIDRRKRLKQ